MDRRGRRWGCWRWRAGSGPSSSSAASESEAFHLDEGFFVILALLVPPLLTLATLGLATVVAQAIRRRPVEKSAFNVGQVLIAAGLGLVVSRGLAAPYQSAHHVEIAAIAPGVVVYFSRQHAAHRWPHGVDGRQAGANPPTTCQIQLDVRRRGALLGVILALAIQQHLWALALAVPVVVLAGGHYRQVRALHDRARMKGLSDVTLERQCGLRASRP